jgi:predicted homoserine dehydrogenase-like protein
MSMAHIVDTALEKRALEGKPVRVGLVGAGFMAKGLVLQIEKVVGIHFVTALPACAVLTQVCVNGFPCSTPKA